MSLYKVMLMHPEFKYGPCKSSVVFRCPQGRVTLRFTWQFEDVRNAIGPESNFKLPLFPPNILLQITKKVQVVLKPVNKSERQISATFPAKDCVQVLDDEWPNEQSFFASREQSGRRTIIPYLSPKFSVVVANQWSHRVKRRSLMPTATRSIINISDGHNS